jgi:hypothetical protein
VSESSKILVPVDNFGQGGCIRAFLTSDDTEPERLREARSKDCRLAAQGGRPDHPADA